ncbi:hypothetical protein ANOBCDAF_03427 [Pleomorphomonas sp. T1.2MG-36]|nr:hypothetical protein ANOBCDAF_03427 [Pleomorphomonas sp. T1.2MG-36]
MFDPWLALRSPEASDGHLHPLVGHLIAEITSMERRKRSRSSSMEDGLRLGIESVTANLVRAALYQPEGKLLVLLARPTDKQSRYDRPGFRKLREWLLTLETLGYVEVRASRKIGVASHVVVTGKFCSLLDQASIAATDRDLQRLDGWELVILRRNVRLRPGGVKFGQNLDYVDTAETRKFREELVMINRWLRNADIGFFGNVAVDLTRKTLHRSFILPPFIETDRAIFDYGGRLGGGWWMSLPKAERRFIRIDGEDQISDLDFSSMFVRLALHSVGAPLPDGDLYGAIPGVETEEHRQAVKTVVLNLLGRSSPLAKLPAGVGPGLPPQLRSAVAVRSAILNSIPGLEAAVERGLCYSLFRTESNILVRALLKLTALNITGLGMHDGIMVAASRAELAKAALQEAAREEIGVELPVVRKM